MSHLLQMRGLKHVRDVNGCVLYVSHLLQMRGLKPVNNTVFVLVRLSHLLQMRGLKQKLLSEFEKLKGRIFYRCVD